PARRHASNLDCRRSRRTSTAQLRARQRERRGRLQPTARAAAVAPRIADALARGRWRARPALFGADADAQSIATRLVSCAIDGGWTCGELGCYLSGQSACQNLQCVSE